MNANKIFKKIIGIQFYIFLLVGLFQLSVFTSFSQNRNLDSLRNCINIDKQDTNKVIHINKFSREFLNIGLFDSTIFYSNKALEFCESNIPSSKGEILKRLKKSKADAFNNIGIVYAQQANFTEALDMWQKALKIDEEIGNKYGIAARNGNIGNIYWNLKDFKKALNYFSTALKLSQDINDNSLIAKWLGNIGNVYRDQTNDMTQDSKIRDSLLVKSLEYYQSALKLYQVLNDKTGIARMQGNIGNVYIDLANKLSNSASKTDSLFKMAEENITSSLKINREIGNGYDEAIQIGNLGQLYWYLKKYDLAEKNLIEALKMFKEFKAIEYSRNFEKKLSYLYYATKNYKSAYDHYVIFKDLNDSIYNSEKGKELVQKEMNFEFEKKESLLKAEQEKKDALSTAEKRKQQIVIWAVAFGLLFVLIFAAYIFRSLKLTRKQNTIIEHQKQIVEEKQKEIIDSINYAKRLQSAILPSSVMVNKILPDSFILYKPKDIVSGDFFWLEQKEGVVLFAAADCTGHGVPGAIVSVVCSNALNRTVKEFGITEPGKILDKVRELVIETFEKSESEVKDGMDISLCSINSTTREVKWAGANNPLWYIVKQDDGRSELFEIKGNKQAIGRTDTVQPFTNHTLQIPSGSTLYLFSDGFADQFGGEKGKKFMYKPMKELLLSLSSKSLAEQSNILESTMDKWKGANEQVDDILIMSVRI